jgi:hypothetical protein
MATTQRYGSLNLLTGRDGQIPTYQINDSDILAANQIIINAESDFAVQDATTITLESGKRYILGAAVTTAKRFICENDVVLTWSVQGPFLTYTGTGDMFTGTDVGVQFKDCALDSPNANQTFNFTDTVAANVVEMSTVIVLNTPKWGTFDGLVGTLFEFSNSPNIDDGITLLGTGNFIMDIEKLAFVSTSASFIGLDMGSAVIPVISSVAFQQNAPAGAVGITGLADSGNVVIGTLANVVNGSFLGGMTALQNISISDVRWEFQNNSGLDDSSKAADSFLTASRTVPIASAGVFVAINGTNWSSDVSERFTSTDTGILIYLGEKNIRSQVVGTATLEKVLGGADQICLRIAVNGTTSAKTQSCTENNAPTSVTSQGLFTLASAVVGTHDGANNAAVLTDTTASFVTSGSGLTGFAVVNNTDGSWATITSNTATTITGVLADGTDDDWDIGDSYSVGTAVQLFVENVSNATDIIASTADMSIINGF